MRRVCHVHQPRTGGSWTAKVLKESGRGSGLGHRGAWKWTPNSVGDALMLGTVRDPWGGYDSLWRLIMSTRSEPFYGAMCQWGGGSHEFCDVLYGWTHPGEADVPYSRPGGVLSRLWTADRMIAGEFGLWTAIFRHMFQTPKEEWAIHGLMDFARLREALAEAINPADDYFVQKELTRPPVNASQLPRHEYTEEQWQWVAEADADYIEAFGWPGRDTPARTLITWVKPVDQPANLYFMPRPPPPTTPKRYPPRAFTVQAAHSPESVEVEAGTPREAAELGALLLEERGAFFPIEGGLCVHVGDLPFTVPRANTENTVIQADPGNLTLSGFGAGGREEQPMATDLYNIFKVEGWKGNIDLDTDRLDALLLDSTGAAAWDAQDDNTPDISANEISGGGYARQTSLAGSAVTEITGTDEAQWDITDVTFPSLGTAAGTQAMVIFKYNATPSLDELVAFVDFTGQAADGNNYVIQIHANGVCRY